MPDATPIQKTSRQRLQMGRHAGGLRTSQASRASWAGLSALSLCLTLTVATLGACKPKESSSETARAWNSANDPVILRGNRSLERQYATLPKTGTVKETSRPWADTYWPSRVGGISARWNSPNPYGFETRLHTETELKNMTLRERATLSPAEKYDIFMSNYSYPLTNWEKRRTSPTALEWEGLCHGVAAASILFEEPKPIVLKNAQGIDVPFGSADIKGLLALYIGFVAQNDVNFVGQRCYRSLPPNHNGTDVPVNVGAGFGRESLTECEDVNAGSFHLVLANIVGHQRETFIADITSGEEVWNHAIVSYTSRETGERRPQATAAPGTVKEKLMETDVQYMVRGVPAWLPGKALLPDSIETKKYRYALELNAAGDIIGGEWLQADYPDFLWKQAKPEFDFYFHKLRDIVDASSVSRNNEDLTY